MARSGPAGGLKADRVRDRAALLLGLAHPVPETAARRPGLPAGQGRVCCPAKLVLRPPAVAQLLRAAGRVRRDRRTSILLMVISRAFCW
ncbi:hypothetical protein [Actinoplanes sp. NPDC020271]|uniref:hypothetical protein n=1 Tax=Actinoplanes sp. NPDC020271 TaxID=3363896 RepID=UPI0037B81290